LLDDLANAADVVAIDFTQPDQAAKNANACLERKLPIVIGTTGWQAEYAAVAEAFRNKGGALLTASNFSPGVNFMLGVARQMAAFAEKFPEFAASLAEVHHVHKKDAPSGTAVSLADAYLGGSQTLKGWKGEEHAYGRYRGCPPYLPIVAERMEEVFGVHTLHLSSDTEELSLAHTAKDRTVFAKGALTAAEWLLGKTGVFGMDDVLGL
jgi:4-hydroxy-tetrahydrodipicolinate reductase